MVRTTITAEFCTCVVEVWNLVTNAGDCSWRSDVYRSEADPDSRRFTEYGRNGIATEFFVTARDEYTLYAFDMKNKNIRGTWKGEFFSVPAGGTKVRFTEEIYFSSTALQLLAQFWKPVQKMQRRYILDLRRRLGEMN